VGRGNAGNTGGDRTAGAPRLLHLDAHPAGPHLHLDLRYLLLSPDHDPEPGPGESQQVRWFTLAEAIDVADDALIDGLRRLQDYVRSSQDRAPT
jgi:hypothetical protein